MTRKPRLGGLTGRVLAGGIVLLAVAGAVLAGLLASVHEMRDAGEATERAGQVGALASRLERLVVDAETAARGFVISGDDDFLQPFRTAQTRIPATSPDLVEATSDPLQREQASRIGSDALAYIDGWAVPLVESVRARGLAEGRRLVASGAGVARADALHARFEAFAAREAQLARERDDAASAAARRAELLGYGGLVLLAALVILAVADASCRAARPAGGAPEPDGRGAEGRQRGDRARPAPARSSGRSA